MQDGAKFQRDRYAATLQRHGRLGEVERHVDGALGPKLELHVNQVAVRPVDRDDGSVGIARRGATGVKLHSAVVAVEAVEAARDVGERVVGERGYAVLDIGVELFDARAGFAGRIEAGKRQELT